MSDIHALSGAYAVDALDDIERAQFEQHLAGCDACRHEVDSLREASALLAETVASEPSAGLRERVLADVATIRPLPPLVPEQAAPRQRRWFAPLLVAAAAVLAIGGGGFLWSQLGDEQSRVDQVLAADDAERYEQTFPDGATATVVRSPSRNEAVLLTDSMPPPPSGKEYALWLQHDDDMVPAGIMPEGPDNAVLLEGDPASANGAGITIEEVGTDPSSPQGATLTLFAFDQA